MSLIKETTALANGATDTVKDTKVSQILGIRIRRAAAIPLAGTSFQIGDLVNYLKLIFISTKLTTTMENLAVNINLFELIKQSTDYKGMCRGSINVDGTSLDIFCPIIQSDGQLGGSRVGQDDKQVPWQLDLVNSTGGVMDITYVGTSFNPGTGYIEYGVNTLENQLQANIPATFNKLMIENTFNRVDMVVNGLMQTYTPVDSEVLTNLDDEVVIGMDVNDGGVTFQVVLWPSDAGSFVVMNTAKLQVQQCMLYRLQAASPVINYSTATFKIRS